MADHLKRLVDPRSSHQAIYIVEGSRARPPDPSRLRFTATGPSTGEHMPLDPFSNYTIEVDLDSEEVIVEAWDDAAPMDIFRGRFSLEDPLGRMLIRITGALRRT